jgi:hypothetical protein
MVKLETGYKRQLVKVLGVWCETYEPGHGSGVGYPDLQALALGRLVPIEVKVGAVWEGRLFPSRIRPSQISWHHDFMIAGGKAFFVVCFGKKDLMNAWALPACDRSSLSRWKDGWSLDNCKPWVSKGKLVLPAEKLLEVL